jgi:hypothetical protein
MDMRISNLLKQKIKEIPADCGVPRREMAQAVYAVFLYDHGINKIGQIEEYLSKPFGYWNLEHCKEDALKYKTRSEWQKENASAYLTARKNGWLEVCCEHMPPAGKPRGYWTLERCQEDALKYKNKTEWRKESPAYGAAIKNGWLDVCCAHMDLLRSPKSYWTLEECKADALKCKTRSEWQETSKPAYGAARKNGWLELCCAHMPSSANKPYGYWTLERCKEDALKYKIKYEWQKAIGGGYFAADKNGWLDVCCAHMTSPRKPNGYWTLGLCTEDALKYKTRYEWAAAAGGSYLAARKNGWLDVCCAHVYKTRNLPGYWTLEMCKEDALKYKTKNEWQKACGGGYLAARKNGWLDKCCTHMPKHAQKKPKNG